MDVTQAQELLLPFFPELPQLSPEAAPQQLQRQALFYANKLLTIIGRINSSLPLQSGLVDENSSKLKQLCGMLSKEKTFEKAKEKVKRLLATERENRYQLYSLSNQNYLLRRIVEVRGSQGLEPRIFAMFSLLRQLYEDMLVVHNYTAKHGKQFKNHQVFKKTVQVLFEKYKQIIEHVPQPVSPKRQLRQEEQGSRSRDQKRSDQKKEQKNRHSKRELQLEQELQRAFAQLQGLEVRAIGAEQECQKLREQVKRISTEYQKEIEAIARQIEQYGNQKHQKIAILDQKEEDLQRERNEFAMELQQCMSQLRQSQTDKRTYAEMASLQQQLLDLQADQLGQCHTQISEYKELIKLQLSLIELYQDT